MYKLTCANQCMLLGESLYSFADIEEIDGIVFIYS